MRYREQQIMEHLQLLNSIIVQLQNLFIQVEIHIYAKDHNFTQTIDKRILLLLARISQTYQRFLRQIIFSPFG